MRDTLRVLLGDNGTRIVGEQPAYLSDVVDDHTPYEMSIALGGDTPELRLLVETYLGDSSLVGRWNAARSVQPFLRDRLGADFKRLDQIADLFDPSAAGATEHGPLLALWHAVAFRAGRRPEVKAYLDLRARGSEHSLALAEEALARLGIGSSYVALLREAGDRGAGLDELVYFSLDLANHDRARVKIYLRHHAATAADAERIIGDRGGVTPGEVREFCTTLLGNEGPYLSRPLVSCWAFSGGSTPTSAAIYAPVAYYVHDDAEARARIHRWTENKDIAPEPYARGLDGYAGRPLTNGVGMHSYVGFKRDQRKAKVTVYLAPEAHRVFPPGQLARRRMPPPRRPQHPVELLKHFEVVEQLTEHPLIARLEREPPKMMPLWAIAKNNWIGVGENFSTWLATLIARVEYQEARTFLAKQLNDELGNGDPAGAHRLLFQRMVADFEPFAPAGDHSRLLAPGRWFAQQLARNYLELPTLEAVGGTFVVEEYGKQLDQAFGVLLRRQTELPVEQLTWLVLHETLEEDHADESAQLAALLPSDPASHAAICRGIENMARLGFRYLDQIYEVLF